MKRKPHKGSLKSAPQRSPKGGSAKGQIKAVRRLTPVATVQNLYNLVDRGSEDVLDYCEANGIGFIPWAPLASGALARSGSTLTKVADKLGRSPSQVALAWVLQRSKVMLPIPGTSSVTHLEENVAAAGDHLDTADFSALDEQGRKKAA